MFVPSKEPEPLTETGFQREVEQTEREQFLTEIDNLRAERDTLNIQLDSMRRTKFGANLVQENDEK